MEWWCFGYGGRCGNCWCLRKEVNRLNAMSDLAPGDSRLEASTWGNTLDVLPPQSCWAPQLCAATIATK
jgi:hypothetical protein